MARFDTSLNHTDAINASWARCRQKHKLARNSAQQILRLQASEIAPRLESLLDRTSGNQGIFNQLAESAARAGNCLVVTDENGILVRLDSKNSKRGDEDWNGIALGSCWDERIAGTNGVSMALQEGRAITVRGHEHFFSKLAPFSCTATPLLDAENQTIGVLNLCAIDRGNNADYLFAHQLLGAAADRIQRNLFEQKYRDARIISVSIPDHRYLFRSDELIAINSDGIILGSTTKAYNLVGMVQPDDLKGKSFEPLFGAEQRALRTPDQTANIEDRDGPSLNLRAHIHKGKVYKLRSKASEERGAKHTTAGQSSQRHSLTPSLRELAIGSKKMATLCARANEYFHCALPFVIEGASGTGKSELVAALFQGVKLSTNQVLTVDCATIGEHEDDRVYFRTLIEQARAIDSLSSDEEKLTTMVFDNIDELPAHAQAELRNLLSSIEVWDQKIRHPPVSDLRIIATCRRSLKELVDENNFRDDLYHLLTVAVIHLPTIGQREHPYKLIRSVAEKLVTGEVEITKEAEQALVNYEWSGNVRQLRSVLKQALIDGNGRTISLVNLAATPVAESPSPALTASDQPPVETAKLKYDERTLLIDALQATNWNVSRAARNLEIGRATIHRKMKRYGITRPEN